LYISFVLFCAVGLFSREMIKDKVTVEAREARKVERNPKEAFRGYCQRQSRGISRRYIAL